MGRRRRAYIKWNLHIRTSHFVHYREALLQKCIIAMEILIWDMLSRDAVLILEGPLLGVQLYMCPMHLLQSTQIPSLYQFLMAVYTQDLQ